VLVVAAALAPASAHDLGITDARVELAGDGTYRLDLRVDVDALALGAPPSADSAGLAARLAAMSESELATYVEGAADTLSRRVRLRFDGEKAVPAEVTFPEWEDGTAVEIDPPTVLGTVARLTGPVPPGAAEMTVGLSRAFGAAQVTVREASSGRVATHLLDPGADTPPFPIGTDAPATAPSAAASFGRYLVLGFEHVVPAGIDHVLFVLGLFLLSTRVGPLLLQVTAFTVAHTATLALSMYGVVSLPSRFVETAIALSIAYVAAENVATDELKPWRPVLVFAFGLLHGLGFAGVLTELGLPEGHFVPALVGFNLGVEAAQLTVVAAAFLLTWGIRGRPWYRRTVVIPASVAIGAVGLWWAVERATGGG
jgi:hypothetical protein